MDNSLLGMVQGCFWITGVLVVMFPMVGTQQKGALCLLNVVMGKLFATGHEDRHEKCGCCKPACLHLLVKHVLSWSTDVLE